MNSHRGRPWIPPEQLSRALLLQILFTVRSERMLMERIDDGYSFSEQNLVRFFCGERREMERYIVDAQRNAVMHASANKLLEFVEWAGKGRIDRSPTTPLLS